MSKIIEKIKSWIYYAFVLSNLPGAIIVKKITDKAVAPNRSLNQVKLSSCDQKKIFAVRMINSSIVNIAVSTAVVGLILWGILAAIYPDGIVSWLFNVNCAAAGFIIATIISSLIIITSTAILYYKAYHNNVKMHDNSQSDSNYIFTKSDENIMQLEVLQKACYLNVFGAMLGIAIVGELLVTKVIEVGSKLLDCKFTAHAQKPDNTMHVPPVEQRGMSN